MVCYHHSLRDGALRHHFSYSINMSITQDDVSCLLHLTLKGRLLDHSMIIRDESLVMIVTNLEVDPGDYLEEIKDT